MKKAIELILFYLLYQLGCGFLFNAISQLIANGLDISESLIMRYSTGILMITSGLLMIGHLFHFHHVAFNRSEFTAESLKSIPITLPFILSSLIAVNLASEWISLPNWMEDTFINMSHNGFGLLSIAVMAPIVEELLFRDAIQRNFMKQGKTPEKAILYTSLLFGLIHINPAQIPFACCIGVVFGWVYHRTGQLLPCITGHLINNTVSATCMALLPAEVLQTPLTHYLGTLPTLILFIASIWIGIQSYLYVNKRYPPHKKQK